MWVITGLTCLRPSLHAATRAGTEDTGVSPHHRTHLMAWVPQFILHSFPKCHFLRDASADIQTGGGALITYSFRSLYFSFLIYQIFTGYCSDHFTGWVMLPQGRTMLAMFYLISAAPSIVLGTQNIRTVNDEWKIDEEPAFNKCVLNWN